MSLMQKPIVGTWYVNPTGMMLKVRMIGIAGKRLSDVVIEYVEGNTQVITIDDWQMLDVTVHAWIPPFHHARLFDKPKH